MTRFKIWAALGLCCTAAWAQNTPPLTPRVASDSTGFVVLCPIEGEINDGTAVVVERAVHEAEGARGLIFLIDTPGGLVDSALEVTDHIMQAGCPTVAYVHNMGAISAGALISFSCDHIIMAPASSIGAAMPFVPGMEPNADLDEKSRSFVRAKFRALAEENGHDPLIGEAMVDRDIELYGYTDAAGRFVIQKTDRAPADTSDDDADAAPAGPPPGLPPDAKAISPRGSLLTLTADEAVTYGLGEFKARDIDEVVEHFKWAELRRVEIMPTWSEGLFGFLTSPMISGLLLMIGLGGIYYEVKTPGFGLPGILGITCLALFFGARLIIGLADWIDVFLVISGIVLMAIEVFILPGFGLAGFSGIACLVAGLYLSLTRVTVPEYSWDFLRLNNAIMTLAMAAIALTALGLLTFYLMPRSRLFNRLVMAHVEAATQGYTVQEAGEAQAYVGLQGVAETMLRPAGRGRFVGRTLDIVTRGEYLDYGTPVVIIQAEGNRLVVTADKEKLG